MARRRLAISTIALAALVVLAGCSGLLGTDPAPDRTATTPGTNETRTRTATASPVSLSQVAFPRGTTRAGIENVSALATAHERTLAGTGYVLSVNVTVQTAVRSRDLTRTIRSDRDSHRLYTVSRRPNVTTYVFQNRSVRFVKSVRASDITVQRRSPRIPFAARHRNAVSTVVLRSALGIGNFTAADALRRNGHTYIRYRLNDTAMRARSDITLSHVSGTLLVSESGLVRTATVSLTGRQNDARFRLHMNYTVSDTGDVAVPRPEWATRPGGGGGKAGA